MSVASITRSRRRRRTVVPEARAERFARRVYMIAGIYGAPARFPVSLPESQFASFLPPAVTHPEFYYGFYGVTLRPADCVPLVIARDPARLVSPMPVTVLVRSSGSSRSVAQGRRTDVVSTMFSPLPLTRCALGILFITSYLRLSRFTGNRQGCRARGIHCCLRLTSDSELPCAGDLP